MGMNGRALHDRDSQVAREPFRLALHSSLAVRNSRCQASSLSAMVQTKVGEGSDPDFGSWLIALKGPGDGLDDQVLVTHQPRSRSTL